MSHKILSKCLNFIFSIRVFLFCSVGFEAEITNFRNPHQFANKRLNTNTLEIKSLALAERLEKFRFKQQLQLLQQQPQQQQVRTENSPLEQQLEQEQQIPQYPAPLIECLSYKNLSSSIYGNNKCDVNKQTPTQSRNQQFKRKGSLLERNLSAEQIISNEYQQKYLYANSNENANERDVEQEKLNDFIKNYPSSLKIFKNQHQSEFLQTQDVVDNFQAETESTPVPNTAKVKRIVVRKRIVRKSKSREIEEPLEDAAADIFSAKVEKPKKQSTLWLENYFRKFNKPVHKPNHQIENAKLAKNNILKKDTSNIPNKENATSTRVSFIMGMLRTMKLKERLAISLGATLILLTLLLVVDVQLDFGMTNRHMLMSQQARIQHQRLRFTNDDGSTGILKDFKLKFLQRR